MTPPALLSLPDDAAQTLAAFLDARDLAHATSISHAASRSSSFQRIRDAQAATLTLPPTSDEDCCRLLQGMYRRNPARIESLQAIHVIAPWQVDVLLEAPAIAEYVQSVLVQTTNTTRTDILAILAQVCERLCDLPKLSVLDVSSTPLANVDLIARMTQLRELDLSRTKIADVSALAALTDLRVFVLEETIARNLECVQDMTRLQILQVSEGWIVGNSSDTRVVLPSLRRLSNLRALVLHKCSVESTADLIHIASSLRQLELTDVHARHRAVVNEDGRPARDRSEDELLARLVQLEIIRLDDKQNLLSNTSATLSKLPSLRAIKHFVDSDLGLLDTVVRLEEINLVVREDENPNVALAKEEDYTFLMRLPHLTKITIKQTSKLHSHATSLGDILPRLDKLTSLDYCGYIPSEAFLPALKHLKHLTHLALNVRGPSVLSFDWIREFHSLRSLVLNVPIMHSDLSAIGELSKLEAFGLSDAYSDRTIGFHGRYGFLAQLVNLKSLRLSGYVEDLELLHGMTKLKLLNVSTSRASVDALRSVVPVRFAFTTWREAYSPPAESNLGETTVSSNLGFRHFVFGDERPKLLRVLNPHLEGLRRHEWRRRNSDMYRDDFDAWYLEEHSDY